MKNTTMLFGAFIAIVGLVGFLVTLPLSILRADSVIAQYRQEFEVEELIYEIDAGDIDTVKFTGGFHVRLMQAEENKISVYRSAKRASNRSLNVSKITGALKEGNYVLILGNTSKYQGDQALDQLYYYINGDVYEDITVYLPKSVSIDADDLRGDLTGLLDVEYLGAYKGDELPIDDTITLEEIRKKHVAIEQSIGELENKLEYLNDIYLNGDITREYYITQRNEIKDNIIHQLDKVMQMLTAHFSLTDEHISIIDASLNDYLELKYEHKTVLLDQEVLLKQYRAENLTVEEYRLQKEELELQERELAESSVAADEKLSRYEKIYLEGFDLID